ncbi:MAG TPA: sigma factor-like helix-turn-helix DNA-binding protein [Pseudoxanthomonas sp.]
MPNTLNDAAAAPAALSAFLRGVERRGALFAELQCGDRDAGDTALTAAMRAFRNHAATLPMAEWPRRFWALLVAAPQLRQDAPVAQWPSDLHALASLDPGLRQALLLRLAAGLPEEEAAAVLGTDAAAYRQALSQACPRDVQGEPDAQAWRALAEAIQRQLRELPPQRLVRLAHLRESALAGTRSPRPVAAATHAPVPAFVRTPRRRRWLWVLLVLALCAAALVATWWWPQWRTARAIDAGVASGAGRVQETPIIAREALPASAPAARFDAHTALFTHPDFELVLDSEEEALARQADFYAWYAAGNQASPEQAPAAADPVAQAAEAETSDAQF